MTVSFADGRIALGLGDPGGLSPLTGGQQNPVTDRWYDSIPAFYREADGNDISTARAWPLYGFMDAVCNPLIPATTIGDRIAAGALTDPALADDAWIPWMASAVGVGGVTVPEQRARLANVVSAAQLGSRAYLTILTQTFLIGTQACQVTAAPPWTIQVTVRSDEFGPGIIDGPGLTAALYATGRIPSGFLVEVVTNMETWAQLTLVMPTWAQGSGQTWGRIQSMGLAGAGISAGGVSWVGHATGV